MARYRDWKRRLLIEALAQVGLEAPIDELIDAHGEGRRRAVFHARYGTLLEVGFAARSAHRVIAIDNCPILAPSLGGAIPAAWAIAGQIAAARKPLDIQVTATEAGLDVDLRGSGPLSVAERARVTAVDNDKAAVVALQKASAGTQGFRPIDAKVRDLFRRPLAPDELRQFDAVVFDPPRQGAEAQVCALAASAVPNVVAVSCNASTFARDARILADGGCRLMRVTPIDQFRYSSHVEAVARFQRTDDE